MTNESNNQHAQNNTVKSTDRHYGEILQLCETVAKSKATVLIAGEAGVGKKLLAAFIHSKSQRASRPLVAFSAKEHALGEQELRFTAAIEEARGGTLLISEVADFSAMLQSRLMRVIQENADIRYLITTRKNLSNLVREGEFREDLFYRLNVVSIKVPALAERLTDVAMIAQEFVQKWSKVHGLPALALSQEAIQLLNGHRWPGNVRELESTMERAVLISAGSGGSELRARDIQFQTRSMAAGASNALAPNALTQTATAWKPGRTLDEIERNVILEALKHHDGNRTHTAKALGISIRTLRNKLAEYRVMGINA